ncbi:type VI secretion system-associated protein VasI [Halodesulfovibrio sp.]|uniref:type VI secretion system-associated protein VasI n=1 Tax=Halodesulfovibrio sp. TaxID=1912772 RepID=UPI0025B84BDD|nr:type VI secretion system-associated protein VasI [Halodesulfovibrio sp.]
MKINKMWTWGLVFGACVLLLLLAAKQKKASVSTTESVPVQIQEKVAAAELCIEIKGRLARLACFDKVFPATIDELLEKETVVTNEKPLEWQRAKASEALRKDEKGFRTNTKENDGAEPSIWFTARAEVQKGKKGIRPILQLGCIDKISRVELLLDEPVADGRMLITVMGEKPFTQQWTSDESGYVLRPGRGIPAIRAMKAMLSSKPIVIRSDVSVVDELAFDNRGLSEAIQPMRNICGW